MKKKGQIVALVFEFMFFIIVFALFLSGFVRSISESALNSGYLDGIASFFIGNFVLWIVIAMIIGALYLANSG